MRARFSRNVHSNNNTPSTGRAYSQAVALAAATIAILAPGGLAASPADAAAASLHGLLAMGSEVSFNPEIWALEVMYQTDFDGDGYIGRPPSSGPGGA
jgi:hypothetical protein